MNTNKNDNDSNTIGDELMHALLELKGGQRPMRELPDLHDVPDLPYRGHHRRAHGPAGSAWGAQLAGSGNRELRQRRARSRPEAAHFLTPLA